MPIMSNGTTTSTGDAAAAAPGSPTFRARALSFPTVSRPPVPNQIPQSVYVGIEFQPFLPNPAFSIYVHDGFYEVDFTTQVLTHQSKDFVVVNDTDRPVLDSTQQKPSQLTVNIGDFHEGVLKRLERATVRWLKDYAHTRNYKIMAAGIGVQPGQSLKEKHGSMFLGWDHRKMGVLRLHAELWSELDILPVVVDTCGSHLDERACAAARKTQLALNPGAGANIARICVGYRHEVEVDADGRIQLCDRIDFQKTVGKDTWSIFERLVKRTRTRKLKVAFFNSTAQGGGVALMRHALLRLLKLVDVDVRWFVMKPKPEIFDITKRKFHNTLQGVADPPTHLEDEDKALFELWAKDNVLRYWSDEEGPLLTSDVIVIDDPQPCGIIPYIKAKNPKCKIIYRSHIEVTANLADDPKTEQHHVWNYLYSFIKDADLFISHPVAGFVPSNVPKDRLLMMPACTDLLDGLNKPLDADSMVYYQSVFNRLANDAIGRRAQFGSRPYVVQIARFDPSKGIPDVLTAYRKLREQLRDEDVKGDKTPQLILAGHGSIDDPDGNLVFAQVQDILTGDEFDWIVKDIIVARLPPSDQLLNALMRGALVALQLSTREGFEVKVTEALAKGVPVIAYAAGGIPHQLRHGRTGYLVPIGDVQKVVHHLHSLVTDGSLHKRISTAAAALVGEDYFTVVSAVNWLYLVNYVSDDRHLGPFDPDTRTEGEDGQGGGKVVRSARNDLEEARKEAERGMQDEERDAAREFDRQRARLSGNIKWVKDMWEEEFYGSATQRRVGDGTTEDGEDDKFRVWRK
ncbi:hypothetical protein HKX48_001135 [Thoreauomyces humboldtii]|nr:hypothetical protein HKX48_001135 [Thoreauomyces humboldtii]